MLHLAQAMMIVGGIGAIATYITLQRLALLAVAAAFIGSAVGSYYLTAWWPLGVGILVASIGFGTKAKL